MMTGRRMMAMMIGRRMMTMMIGRRMMTMMRILYCGGGSSTPGASPSPSPSAWWTGMSIN